MDQRIQNPNRSLSNLMLHSLLEAGYDATLAVDEFLTFKFVSMCWFCRQRVWKDSPRFMILRTEAELWQTQVPWIHETQHVVLVDLVE